ncbi:hypothetical protein TRFO_19254 [Tritrichomonas foetus]|uniref:Surface antigen BspA-like n=1 Tax=Tritrichomonas foetus TaxID=1144522 RepID=A0A1J4KJG5_9EUKA|nr:hypothetical protein TRFO_19254 [Tritrichomonas foetus]|eukprot:OHT11363.1 hypothetical protein TRFO_19254 [Tritrichomonas foetus]
MSLESINIPYSPKVEIESMAFYNCKNLTKFDHIEKYEFILANYSRDAFLNTKIESFKLSINDYFCFSGLKSLKHVYFHIPVQDEKYIGIPNLAFSGTGIETIDLSGFYFIGDYAFQDCHELKSVVIKGQDQFYFIGNSAFLNCTSLETFEVPCIFHIGNSCFENCASFNSPLSTMNLNYIGKYAFRNSGVKSLSGNIKYIGKSAFQDCKSLQSFENSQNGNYDSDCFMNSSIESFLSSNSNFGSSCFENCQLLKKFTIEENLKEHWIDNNVYTFYQIFQKKIQRRERYYQSNPSFGIKMFQNSGIAEIEIPSDLCEVPSYCFYGCKKLQKVIFKSDYNIGSNIHEINSYAFAYSGLKSIVFPERLCSIRDHAFYNTLNLKNTTFDESIIEFIGTNAFGFSGIESVRFPTTIKEISSGAFSYCNNLRIVTFELNKCTIKIGDHAFMQCKNLATFECDNMVGINIDKSDPNYSFVGCSNLKTLNIKNNLYQSDDNKIIDGITYNKNMSKMLLMSSQIPNHLRFPRQFIKMPKHAFAFTLLTEVIFEKSTNITHLPNYAFYSTLIRKFVLPDTVKSIGCSCFEDCKDLKTFVISQESNLTSLGNYCFMNTAIKAIYIPQNVQKIPPYCFAKCNNLKSFSLSNYHKTNVICEYAFFKSGIEALKLPKKLIIENDAFSYCKLKTLFLENSQEINTCSFSNNPLESVYIKFNSKFFKEEQYKIDDLSNKFSSELSLCTNHQHRFLKPHDSSLCSLIDKLRNFFNAFLGCQNMKSFMLVFHYQGTIAISPKEYHNDNEQINNGCSPSNIDKMIDSILNHLVETRKRQLKYIPFEKVSDNNKFDPRSFSHNYHHRFNGNEFMFSQLFEITIPKQITKLNDKLFYGCTNLTKINFETHSTLHVIGEYCFVGTKIESIILPNWCHELRKGCFKDVSSLEHIECNEIHLLDDEALSGTSINSFIFNNLNFLGNSVFRECKCLTSIKHVNCNYQEIGMNCFENTNIKQFKLPPTVSIIRKNAFCGCSHLKKFNIPHSSSLLYIEGMAFTDTAIKSLNIPNTIAFIDQSAFVKTPNLTSIFANNEIDNPEYEIDSKTGAVYYLPLFERVKIKIPKRVPYNSKYNKNGEKNDKYDYLTVYEEKCDDEYPQEVIVYDTHCSYSNPRSCRNRFSSKYPQKYHKKHAKKAVKSDTIKKIYQHLKKILLLVPRNIQKFDVPKDVNEIGSSAFSGSIQKVKFIEPSITTILHKDSFACSNLEQIELPNSIKLIGESCFNGCQELRKVLFHGNFLELREIPQFCFSFCTSLESINLPISIRKIGSCAFNCCFNLRNVNLSQLLLLEEVNSSAFMQTSLEEILFPPKIKKIDKCSFSEIRTLHLVDFTKTIVNLCNDPRHEIFSSRNHHIVNYYFAQLKSLPKYRNNYISYLKHHPKNACFDYFYTRNHFNYLTFIDKFECADVDTFTTIIEEEKARKKESIEEEEYVVCEAQSDSYNDEYISYSRRPTRATQIKSVKFENCSFKNYYKKLNEINYIDEFSFAGSFANIVRLNENIIATEFFKHFGKIDLLEKPNVKFELKLQTNHYNNVLFTSKFRIRNYEIVNSSQCDIMTNQPINEIVLPESLKPIPYTNSQFLFPLHFHGCQQLTTVNFHPELKLENIPPYCFAFTNIETITFPRFLKTIDYNAFLYCTNLKMMTFTYLETSETENLNKLTIKNSFSGSGVEILDLRGYSVINIEESSFSGCKNLKKVIFGEKTQIQTIKKYSFAYSGLESFDFPESVEKIDEGAFDGCKLLETVNFNQNLNKIGQFAFRFTKINNVFIPKSVIEIGKGAFSNCLSLIKADFETHRKLQIKIQKGAFEYSSISSLNIPLANYFHLPNLKEVKFNENLLKKSQRFDQITHENGCITKKKKLIFIPTDIIELEIPAIVSKWKPNIFANCKKLEIIRFDKNSQIQVLHPIHSSTLKFIEIPASVSIICDCAFLGCNSLLSFSILTDEKIEGKSSLTQIGKRAFSETKVSEFKVPLNLKSIGESAFEKTNLASLVFDSDDDNSLKNYKLQVIGQKCFYESFLTSLSLPPSLTSIGKYAFYHSPHLRTVNFCGEPESSLKLGKHCFARADKRLVLNVQNGVKLNHFYGDNYKINLM